MPDAISNTSPLLYLHRIGGMNWLPELFTGIYVTGAVVFELMEGRQKGYDVPNPSDYDWITIVEPQVMPSECGFLNKFANASSLLPEKRYQWIAERE